MVLKHVYNFPGLKREDLDKIFKAHKKVQFKAGEFLLQEGSISDGYCCLESGIIRSFAISNNGHDITTDFFCKGDVVIEVASLFLHEPTKENFQAVTDCVCWKIEFNDFQQLFEQVNRFADWGRSWMSTALTIAKQRTLSNITDTATTRYLKLLEEKPEIFQFVALKHIASYLGITNTSLSRIRRDISYK